MSVERGEGFAERFDGETRADEKCGGFAQHGMLSNGKKMHRTIVPDFLENLKFAGLFAQDDEALGAEDFFGKPGEKFFEGWLGDRGGKRDFAGGEVVLGVVVMVRMPGFMTVAVRLGGFVEIRKRADFLGEGNGVRGGCVDAECGEGFFDNFEAGGVDGVGAGDEEVGGG